MSCVRLAIIVRSAKPNSVTSSRCQSLRSDRPRDSIRLARVRIQHFPSTFRVKCRCVRSVRPWSVNIVRYVALITHLSIIELVTCLEKKMLFALHTQPKRLSSCLSSSALSGGKLHALRDTCINLTTLQHDVYDLEEFLGPPLQ